MSHDLIIQIFRETLKTMLFIISPVLLLTLIIGLAISIFQAVTQIHEMTLVFVPKILLIIVCLIFFFPWMINMLTGFTIELITNIPVYVR